VVFDLGSRDARQALDLAAAFPNANVHAFECNPQTLPICRANASANGRITVVPRAVHEHDGRVVFHAIDPERTKTSWPDGNPGASSLFLATGEYPFETYVQRPIEVEATRIDTYCRTQGMSSVDVAWMDLQGAELMALRSFGRLLSCLDFLHTEVSYRAIYRDQCLFPEVDNFLVKNGFVRSWHRASSDWQGDAVYVGARRATLDVVIPCAERDAAMLSRCIEGVRRCLPQARRVFVVSERQLTSDAEWLSERRFPFTIEDVRRLLPAAGSRAGWYLQQLLKLYCPFVFPGATHRVLVVDADTVFLRTCRMLDERGYALYALSGEHHAAYFSHMERLLPALTRVASESGIVHHLIFDRTVLETLFAEVEAVHRVPFWQAFLETVAPRDAAASGASEYEIYLNYVLQRFPHLARTRPLMFANVPAVGDHPGLDFVSAHWWLRS
jgi:FkbM family methyltransferase